MQDSVTRNFRVFIALGAFVFLAGCELGGYETITGRTMGTYYRVVSGCSSGPSETEINVELTNINAVMSHYIDDSTVSRFNRAGIDEWIDVESSLAYVVQVAQEVSEVTAGNFDITVAPLVDAWGFGKNVVDVVPAKEQIENLLPSVGFRSLEVRREPPSLRKRQSLAIDLSGIAKGYGVDQIAAMFEEVGCGDYLVDIGGEIRARGSNEFRKPWQTGIEYPDGSGDIFTSFDLSSGAVATTGDYLNFRVIGEERFSHVVDPATGYPVDHKLAGVTVVMNTAIEADAFATALFAMGEEEGLAFAQEFGIAALFFVWNEDSQEFDTEVTSLMELVFEPLL